MLVKTMLLLYHNLNNKNSTFRNFWILFKFRSDRLKSILRAYFVINLVFFYQKTLVVYNFKWAAVRQSLDKL